MTIKVEPKAIAEVRDQMLQAVRDVDGYLDQLEGVVAAQVAVGWEGAAKEQYLRSRQAWESILGELMTKLSGSARALEDAASGLLATDTANAAHFPGA